MNQLSGMRRKTNWVWAIVGRVLADRVLVVLALIFVVTFSWSHFRVTPLFKSKVLTIIEGVFGPEHPYTAKMLSSLASTRIKLKQDQESLPLQYRALEITEKALGQSHPDIVFLLDKIAVTHIKLGQSSA